MGSEVCEVIRGQSLGTEFVLQDFKGSANESLCIRLDDGRRLGYAEYGDSDGSPVFLFHGTPCSRLMFRSIDPIGKVTRTRLIALDRPGIGLSDPQPGRTLLDWPGDVATTANRLGIDRFAVAGVSGGGPYAAACLQVIPERLLSVGVVSGMGPLDVALHRRALAPRYRALFAIAAGGGPAWSLVSRAVGFAAAHWPSGFLDWASQGEPSSERTRSMLSAVRVGTLEAFRNGVRGPADDVRVLAQPWGFAPRPNGVPVHLWHGDRDTIVPAVMSETLAERVCATRAEIIPGAGHFWGLLNAETIISALIEAHDADPSRCSTSRHPASRG